MAWVYLFVAGLFEIGWAVGLKYTQGFTRPLPTLGTLLAMIASFALLALALRSLPLGTAYATWTGIGIIGSFLFGVFVLGESASLARIACVGLIASGIIGLKLLTDTTG